MNYGKFPSGRAVCRGMAALAATLAIVLSAIPSSAHRVRVFAFVEGDTVQVEGYFNKKNKAINCAVEVFDSTGKKILTGKTDRKGRFSFPAADLKGVRGDVRVVLVAGEGHRAEYSLGADELPGSGKAAAESPSSPGPSATAEKIAPGKKRPEAVTMGSTELKQIRRMIEETVKKENKAIIHMLGQQRRLLMEMRDRGPTFKEIVGGIGWIFGIIGTAAYFMSRKRAS
jgi:nickel transport protein